MLSRGGKKLKIKMEEEEGEKRKNLDSKVGEERQT